MQGVVIEFVWGPWDGELEIRPVAYDEIRLHDKRTRQRIGTYERAVIRQPDKPLEYYWRGE